MLSPSKTGSVKAAKSSSPSSLSGSKAPAGSRRRSISAPVLPAPSISIEDESQPLSVSEDSNHPTPRARTPARQNTGESSSSTASSDTNKKKAPDTRRSSTWKPHKRSPGVGWKKRWDADHNCFADGRVLIVDCYSRDFSDDGKRKTAAYEFADIKELRDFYSSEKGKGDGQCLRIVHVQNAVWARDFLLAKFNITSKAEDVVGTAFGRWVKFDNPQLRAGKPVLNAKSFRCIKDPWRGVSRTGFGLDYLKSFRPGVIKNYSDAATKGFKLTSLNHWDDEGTTPLHGYDVYVQRISVYVQHKEGNIDLHPTGAEFRNPYMYLAYDHNGMPQPPSSKEAAGSTATETDGHRDDNEDTHAPPRGIPKRGTLVLPDDWEGKVFDKLTELDNGNTVIVFESSHTARPNDTLIQAREEIEVRWRRIMLYLNREEQSEDKLAMECMDLVLRDIFKGVQTRWEKTMAKCEAHVSILEDKIYENPADESRAPELWNNSALWLKIEKLISLHSATVKDLQQQMRELSESEEFTKEDWLRDTPSDLERIANLFEEEMSKPTASLSDLMYKSVEIRDSRQSLQLGTSVWRLSWITFIFLPLTFMVGFFGMNVDVFQPPDGNFPSLKWYFIASIPLMILVVIVYIFIKSNLSTSHDIPMQRGVYEQIYNQFADEHPHLWSNIGPRSYVRPKGLFAKLKWRVVKGWFHPTRTISQRSYTEIDEMGLWARIKRRLAQRWLAQIEVANLDFDEEGHGDGEFGTITELLALTTPVAMADGWPSSPPLRRMFTRRTRTSSESRRSDGRATSPGNEVMMIEEEKSDDESSGGDRRKRPKQIATAESQKPAAARAASNDPGFSPGFLSVPFGSRKSEDTSAAST